MKIILIGDFNGKSDEGLSQISQKIFYCLKENYDLTTFNTYETINPLVILHILKLKPKIIHYITGPTLKSFFIVSILKIFIPGKVRTIISATRPFIQKKYFFLLNYFDVDLILFQSVKWNNIFKKYNYNTKFLPNPVNVQKFKKSSINTEELKKKYGLPLDKKILLHIGHIRRNRNLQFMIDANAEVNKLGYCIVIVSSTYFKKDLELYNMLINSGIIVKSGYYEKINEFYSLADCYLFPVKGLESDYFPTELEEIGVIDMPLSILEAVASDLPVLSTEIDSIKTLCSIHNISCPLTFWDGSKSDFINKLSSLQKSYINSSQFKELISDDNFKNKLTGYYRDILS